MGFVHRDWPCYRSKKTRNAVSYDNRVDNKEAEKIDKYQDLAREIKRLWNTQVKVIPVVIDALGTTLRLLPKRLKDIGIETSIVDLQKSSIFRYP